MPCLTLFDSPGHALITADRSASSTGALLPTSGGLMLETPVISPSLLWVTQKVLVGQGPLTVLRIAGISALISSA